MKRYGDIFIVSLFIVNPLLSMKETITFFDNQRKPVDIPAEVVKKFTTLKDCLENANEYSNITLPFEKQTITDLILYIQKKKKLREISQIPMLWQSADYLALEQSLLIKLTKFYKKSLHQEDPLQNKLKKTFNDISRINHETIENGYLDLSNKRLDRISEIHRIPQVIRNTVSYLDVSNNNLATLNLKKTLPYFPHLRGLSVAYNKIKKVKPFQMPDNFYLDLSHNKLRTLPKSSLAIHDGHVDISHNLLKAEVIEQGCASRCCQNKLKMIYEFNQNLLNYVGQNKFVLGGFFSVSFCSFLDLIINYSDYLNNQKSVISLSEKISIEVILWLYTLALWLVPPYMETKENYQPYKKPYINDRNQMFIKQNSI